MSPLGTRPEGEAAPSMPQSADWALDRVGTGSRQMVRLVLKVFAQLLGGLVLCVVVLGGLALTFADRWSDGWSPSEGGATSNHPIPGPELVRAAWMCDLDTVRTYTRSHADLDQVATFPPYDATAHIGILDSMRPGEMPPLLTKFPDTADGLLVTPLIAAIAGDAERRGFDTDDRCGATADLLLDAGAAVDGPPGVPVHPLWFAAAVDDSEMVDRLLDAGADPSLRVEGRTPLEVAQELEHAFVVMALATPAAQDAATPSPSDVVEETAS